MYHPEMPDRAPALYEQEARRRTSLRRVLFNTLGAVALGVLFSSLWW